MLRTEYLVLCVGLLVICKDVNAAARKQPRSNKRHDEALQTYIFEPSDDFQADATTIYPPLVESDSNSPIVSDSMPDTPVDAPPIPPPPPKAQDEVSSKLPEGPVQSYFNSYGPPYYSQPGSYPSNYYQAYPWQYISQSPYLPQANVQSMPQNYVPMQPEYEGILVPVQTLAPPPSSSLRAHQTQMPAQAQPTPQTNPTNTKNSENKITPVANRNSFDLALILQALLPPSVITFIIAIGNFFLNSFSTLAFAGAITSVLCTVTPICTLSFGSLPFGFRQILLNSGEVSTIQRVRRAAEVVSSALEKYEKLQQGVESLTNSLKKAQRSL